MFVERISSFDELQNLEKPWDELCGDHPHTQRAWLWTWWKHFQKEQDELYVLLVRDDQGQIVLLAPWALTNRPVDGRTIIALGSGNVCTDYLGMFIRESTSREKSINCLADWLVEAAESTSDADRNDRWESMLIDGADREDESLGSLLVALARRGSLVRHNNRWNSWRVGIPDSFDEFVSKLSKKRRAHTRRCLRKHVETGKVIARHATPESFDELWDHFIDLHQKRRNSLGELGCFSCDRFADFLREAAQGLMAQDRAHLIVTFAENQPAAAQFLLQDQRTTYVYQTGMEPSLMQMEPGKIATAMVIQHCVDTSRKFLDFMRGDEPYKANWNADLIPLLDVRVVPATASARLRDSIRTVGGTAKRMIKSGLEAAGWR